MTVDEEFGPTAQEFIARVLALVAKVPRGRVATYGQIAEAVGRPWGSRGVSMVIHARDRVDSLPWHRIVRSNGRIKFRSGATLFARQSERLSADGVSVRDGFVDLDTYGWRPSKKSKSRARHLPRMF